MAAAFWWIVLLWLAQIEGGPSQVFGGFLLGIVSAAALTAVHLSQAERCDGHS